MIIVYDTETSGLPLDHEPDDHPGQPHLVELASILYDDTGRERAAMHVIIAPEGRYDTMDVKALAAHGISIEDAQACGIALGTALPMFYQLAARADTIVAHNINFDDKIMRYALARLGRKPTLPYPAQRCCTMRMATPLMQLPPSEKMRAAGYEKFKPPSLAALYRFLFDEGFAGAHSADADARACARTYFELRKRGVADA